MAKKRPRTIKKLRTPKPAGRPALYTPELAREFCRRISGGASMRKVCEAPDMPDRDTVFGWMGSVEAGGVDGFPGQYARACEERGHFLAEQALEVTDEDVPMVATQFGQHMDAAAVQKQRLRVDTRKWFASKLHPRIYADKVNTELTGAGGGPVLIAPPDYQKLLAAHDAKYGSGESGV